MHCFHDRNHAGELLAEALVSYKNRVATCVVALPRGGVPVAYPIALALHLPLSLCVVRKLGLPGQKEVAVGAIAEGVEVVYPSAPPAIIEQVKTEELQELQRRTLKYRTPETLSNFAQKTVILVDDGIATGYTMRAAAQSIQRHSPTEIVIAVPVAPPEICAWFEQHIGKLVALVIPPHLRAISLWYEDFSQVSDEEVCHLLHQVTAAHEARQIK